MALEELNIAVAADKTYAPAFNALGLVHMDLKEDDQAEKYFRQAIKIDPSNSETKNNYGMFLCQRGRQKEGIRQLLDALKNPLYATPDVAYKNAGLCARKAGDTKSAEEYFLKALKLNPNQPQALYNLAEINYQRDDYAAAKQYMSRYFTVTENAGPEALWLAARIERKIGDRTALANYGLQLRRRYPSAPETKAFTGRSLRMTEPAEEPLFDPEVPAPAEAAPQADSPGAQLLDERRNQGLSLGDIARQLKLSVRQIEALERDDYASFSGPVFVRGFLRNYAKLLHLDPEPLLAAASLSVAPAAVHATAEAYVPVSAASPERRRKFIAWGAFVVLVVLVVFLLAANVSKNRPNTQAPETAQPTPAETPSTLAATPQHADSPPAASKSPAPSAAAEPTAKICRPLPLPLRNRRNRNRLPPLLRRQRLQQRQLRLPRHSGLPSRQCQTP